jgi:Phage-related lysozyme (muraminidase)
MNRESVFEQLKIDEGVVYEIYLDHLGYPTFGVGHLVVKDDPEYAQEVGTPVSEERVAECFDKDLDIAIDECYKLYGPGTFNNFPGEVQEVLVNMLFNLGRPRLSKFQNFNAKLIEGDYAGAAPEGLDSLWARQVGARAERLMERLKTV